MEITKTPLKYDARHYTHPATLCQHAGHELSPEGDRQCKYFDESQWRTDECTWYRDMLGWCRCTENQL